MIFVYNEFKALMLFIGPFQMGRSFENENQIGKYFVGDKIRTDLPRI